MLLADDEESAEIYGAAKDVKQARKVWDVAYNMLRLSPALNKLWKAGTIVVNRQEKKIIYEPTGPLALDTPVPTPFGWTTMGDIKQGDQIFGQDGNVCTVWGVSPIYTERPCYRVTFMSGEVIVASADHLWETDQVTNKNQIHKWGKKSVVTTRDIAQTVHAAGDTTCNHRIRLAEPFWGPDDELPLDPYLFGH